MRRKKGIYESKSVENKKLQQQQQNNEKKKNNRKDKGALKRIRHVSRGERKSRFRMNHS